MKTNNIIYEDNHLLVVEKPINIPVCQDDSQDADFLSILKNYLKEKYQKPGNVYLGLVHRLDRPVGGVMVFAKTSKAASRLSEQVRLNQISKSYLAVVEGELNNDTLIDYLIKDSKTNTVSITTPDKGKYSELSYQVLDYQDHLSLISVELKTGRSHQIRVQFSSRNHPLWGDQRYNSHSEVGQQIALFANKLEFYHPITKEKMIFSLERPSSYPYNIFKKER